MSHETRVNTYYWEPWIDELTNEDLGLLLQVDVWSGDSDDRPGQQLLGKEVLQIARSTSGVYDSSAIEKLVEAARKRILGITDDGRHEATDGDELRHQLEELRSNA